MKVLSLFHFTSSRLSDIYISERPKTISEFAYYKVLWQTLVDPEPKRTHGPHSLRSRTYCLNFTSAFISIQSSTILPAKKPGLPEKRPNSPSGRINRPSEISRQLGTKNLSVGADLK